MTKEEILARIDERLGRVHARQRLGIESDHEAQIFGQGINFFHPENWYSVHAGIRTFLKVTGLYWRGKKNTERITILEIRGVHDSSTQRSARRYESRPNAPPG
jgi:hypothetical protein